MGISLLTEVDDLPVGRDSLDEEEAADGPGERQAAEDLPPDSAPVAPGILIRVLLTNTYLA